MLLFDCTFQFSQKFCNLERMIHRFLKIYFFNLFLLLFYLFRNENLKIDVGFWALKGDFIDEYFKIDNTNSQYCSGIFEYSWTLHRLQYSKEALHILNNLLKTHSHFNYSIHWLQGIILR